MKTLILDIETSPNVAHVWNLYNQNVSLDQLQEPSFTLCWAAKWHQGRSNYWRNYTEPEFYSEILFLLDEADVVVHYNGDRFDLPILNKEFLIAGYPPSSPYHSVDLYKVIKKKFRFASGKLKHVAEQLQLTNKIQHEGHELWVKVMQDDLKAWKKMRQYNIGDLKPTEELFDRLYPWIDNLPNRNLFVDSDHPVCPNCGSEKLQRRGFAYTKQRKYRRYVCTSCNKWSRGVRSEEGVEIQVAT